MEQPGPREERRKREGEGDCGRLPLHTLPASPFSGLSQIDAGDDDGGGEDVGDDDVGIAAAAVAADNGDTRTEATLITDQDEFLTHIHQNFVKVVDPPHLIDELLQAKALSSEDEQSIIKETTRRKRARKLWDMLHRITPEDFADSFVPQLRAEYPHVMKGLAFRLSGGPCQHHCLRHAMRRRLKLHRVIDLLPSHNCCTRDQYRRLTASQFCGETEWQEVFHLLHMNSANPDLCTAMETMLREKKIGGAVEQYREVAAGGFVCTCHRASSCGEPSASREPSNADDKAVLKSMLDLTMMPPEEESSATYPSSPLSSKSQALDSMSDMSEHVDSGVGPSFANQPLLPPDLPSFQTLSQKNRYKQVEGEINHAITRSSNLRTDFRKLEKLRDDARSRAKQAQDEALTAATNEELNTLLEGARWLLSLIRDAFQEVQGMFGNVADLDQYLGLEMAEGWMRYLRRRHHLLRNEVQECRHFADRASAVVEEVTAICRPLPPAQKRGGTGGEERSGDGGDARDGGGGNAKGGNGREVWDGGEG